MAVTLTAADLAIALRLTATTAQYATLEAGQQAVVTRTLATATAMVTRYAPAAPDTAHDEAVARLGGWLFDTDPADARRAQSPMHQSGAAPILAPWRTQAAALPTGAATTPATPSPGGAGVDATARAEAATALRTAEAAQTTATRNAGRLMPPNTAEADAAVSTTIRGWTAALIRRVVESIVPSWARQPSAPAGPYPTYAGAIRAFLSGRAGAYSWEAVNEVPDTPGTSSAVGHSLTVTGRDDQDYAWRETHDASARSDAASASGVASDVRLALASLEDALPDPPVPAAGATATSYSLHLPATTERSTRATWVPATGGDAGTTDATARRLITQAVTDRQTADTALGERIDALTTPLADPIFEPGYWVKTGAARTIIVHFDPAAFTSTVADALLRINGTGPAAVAKVADQDVYPFAISAADAASITASAGNAGRDTVTVEVTLRDSSQATVSRWVQVLLVRDTEPATAGGGGGSPVKLGSVTPATTERFKNFTRADAAKIWAARTSGAYRYLGVSFSLERGAVIGRMHYWAVADIVSGTRTLTFQYSFGWDTNRQHSADLLSASASSASIQNNGNFQFANATFTVWGIP